MGNNSYVQTAYDSGYDEGRREVLADLALIWKDYGDNATELQLVFKSYLEMEGFL